MKPILLTVAGISGCRKSDSLMEMLRKAVTTAEEAMRPLSSYNSSGGGCGLPYYEMVAVGTPTAPLIQPVYKEATKDTCYQFAMESAITHCSRPIKKIDSTTLNEGYFDDKELEEHFCRIFEYLEKNYEASSESSEWQKKIPNGLSLINIWDIGVNKAVFHFLPALWGHLHKSYLWLFLDIDEDINNLYQLPNLPENECEKDKKDRELIMRYRCRLHYLLRHVMLVRSQSKQDSTHEPTCSVFALQEHGALDDLNKMKDEIMSVAGQMGVKSSMNERISVLQHPNDVRLLKSELDAIVNKTLDSAENIPLSFVFLRSFFYAHDMMYITKSQLKKKASKLKMTDDQTEKFCKVFMSSGSIIDVSQIDPSSSYVIVKPMRFLSELDQLFYATSDIDSLLPEYGLLTQETAIKIFGSTYCQFFMDVLLSVDLAMKVTYDQINCECPLSRSEAYLYLPDIRIQPPILTCDLSALHLKLNINCALSHLQVLFAKAFLLCRDQSVLVLERNAPVNITKFRIRLVNREDSIDFQLKYLGDVVEFQILESSSLPDESVYANIVKACNEMMKKSKWLETKYNFVMMCAENADLSNANRLSRTCHVLPSDLCQCCQKNDEQYRHLQLWNAAIRKVCFKYFRNVIIINCNFVLQEKVLKGRMLSLVGG